MQLVQIDVIGLQSLQTRLHRLHHVLAMVTRCVRVRTRHRVCILRRQHHAAPVRAQEFAQQFLTGPVGVQVGGVDKISPRLPKNVVLLPAVFRRRASAPIVPKRHGAQA